MSPRLAYPSGCDVVLVGIGAAGLAAAAVLGRSRRSVVVVGMRERGNAGASKVHNLPYAEGVSPSDLYVRMERELDQYDIPILAEHVELLSGERDADVVRVRTAGHTIAASRVLLANGVESLVPGWVPAGLWGTTVFDCPFCHAYEHRGEDFVVVGPSGMAVHMALLCTAHARSMTVVTADQTAATGKAADQVRQLGGEVLHDTIDSGTTDESGRLDLITSSGQHLTAGAVLLSGITRPRRSFVDQLDLKANEFGIPDTDADGKSSHPLVWVAGTAARPYYTLVEAMGSGIRSAIAIHKDLALKGLS